MPKYRTTFDDGSTIEVDANNANDAKQRAKSQALQNTGARDRNDARVKVMHTVNLDEEPGPTDPRRSSAGGDRGRDGGR